MTETGQGHEVVNAAENVIGNCNNTLCAFHARQTDEPVCFCKKYLTGINCSLESGFCYFANITFSVGKQNCDIRSVPVNTVIRHDAGSHFILDFTIK